MEPYMTICKERKHPKYGPIFGVYYKPEVIPTVKEFKELLPSYDVPKDRSLGITGIIKAGDSFKLRIRKKTF